MKKLLLLLAFVLVSTITNGQEKITKVVLKNGIAITGTLKELNPVSHLVLSVSGIETRIEMGDVAEVISSDVNSSTPELQDDYHIVPQDLLDQEAVELPDTFTLTCAGQSIEMVLIRGGRFKMGYDGRGSMKMQSEPVHEVFVSSFYVNKSAITIAQSSAIRGKKVPASGSNKPYVCRSWTDVEKVVENIVTKTTIPIRVITEAEWEYLASSESRKGVINMNDDEVDFCYDFFGDYPKYDRLYINPMGPEKGTAHVRRRFGPTRDIFCDRISIRDYSTEMNSGANIRLVIPIAYFIK